jgi:hypothetical protein
VAYACQTEPYEDSSTVTFTAGTNCEVVREVQGVVARGSGAVQEMNPCYAAPADDFDECESEEDWWDEDDFEDWPKEVSDGRSHIAHLRRHYLHLLAGGKLKPSDLARHVERAEELDARRQEVIDMVQSYMDSPYTGVERRFVLQNLKIEIEDILEIQ